MAREKVDLVARDFNATSCGRPQRDLGFCQHGAYDLDRTALGFSAKDQGAHYPVLIHICQVGTIVQVLRCDTSVKGEPEALTLPAVAPEKL